MRSVHDKQAIMWNSLNQNLLIGISGSDQDFSPDKPLLRQYLSVITPNGLSGEKS